MQLTQHFLTQNPCYRANVERRDSRYTRFQSRGPMGLMLHSVGCAQPSAAVFLARWDRPEYTNACVHAVIDANTGEVFQTLPWNFRGWHCGGSGNDTHVGVELCEPAALVYGSGGSFTIRDRDAAAAAVRRTWKAAVELFAQLCAEYALDPMTAICSHREGGRQGIASGHTDPEHLWEGLGLDFTMDGFRTAVRQKLARTQTLYRIQLGAFHNKDYAEAWLAKVRTQYPEAYLTRSCAGK